jgi:hypothetical protein
MKKRSDGATVPLGMPEFVVGAQLEVGRELWLIVETLIEAGTGDAGFGQRGDELVGRLAVRLDRLGCEVAGAQDSASGHDQGLDLGRHGGRSCPLVVRRSDPGQRSSTSERRRKAVRWRPPSEQAA